MHILALTLTPHHTQYDSTFYYDQVDLMNKQYEEGPLHEKLLQQGIHLIYGKLGNNSVLLFRLGCHNIVIYDIHWKGK